LDFAITLLLLMGRSRASIIPKTDTSLRSNLLRVNGLTAFLEFLRKIFKNLETLKVYGPILRKLVDEALDARRKKRQSDPLTKNQTMPA
jgi:hypothetical protein